jgi:hypothetical protein
MSLFKDNFIYRGYDVRERVTDYSIHKNGISAVVGSPYSDTSGTTRC